MISLGLKQDIFNNIHSYITKTNLLLNKNVFTANEALINQILEISKINEIFCVQNYILFKNNILQILRSPSCDILCSIGGSVLLDANKSHHNIATAGMLFRFANELASGLHVNFHYHGAAIFYNLFLLYGFIDKTKCKQNLEKALFLMPSIAKDFFIPKPEDDFASKIELLNTVNPHNLIKRYSNFLHEEGNIIILPHVFKAKYNYIDIAFNAYKQDMTDKHYNKLLTAIPILENIATKAQQHHLHYHISCADILFNLAICEILTNNTELAVSNLTKAIEFEKSNPKNALFNKILQSTLNHPNN